MNNFLCDFTDVEHAKEYCAYENFHPSCSKNEVIVMSSAIYGRMKAGRCLEMDMAAKQDPRWFGCSVDVLKFMDGKCSGKPECNVRVNDQELLRQESSCYKDLMKYLESVHACVPGKYLFHSYKKSTLPDQQNRDQACFINLFVVPGKCVIF